MTPTEHLQSYHRFDELVATYLACFPDAVDTDAAEDADIAQMSADMARGFARGEPIPVSVAAA